MRISAEAARAAGKRYRVTLDGVEQRFCWMADDERGVVEVAVLDDAGQLQPDPEDPEHLWKEFRRGKVTIEEIPPRKARGKIK